MKDTWSEINRNIAISSSSIPPPSATTMIRPPLTRSSSLCRSRRSLLSSPQSSLMSPDPDLLSMASSSLSYRPEADDEHIMFSSDRRGYVAVAGTPRNGFTVWTHRCFIQTFTLMLQAWELSGASYVEDAWVTSTQCTIISSCLTWLISSILSPL